MIVGLSALRVMIGALTMLVLIASLVMGISEWRSADVAGAVVAGQRGLVYASALLIAAVAVSVAFSSHARMDVMHERMAAMQERMAVGDTERQRCLELLAMLLQGHECTAADVAQIRTMYAAQMELLGAAASTFQQTGTDPQITSHHTGTGTGPQQPYLWPIR